MSGAIFVSPLCSIPRLVQLVFDAAPQSVQSLSRLIVACLARKDPTQCLPPRKFLQVARYHSLIHSFSRLINS